jgi:PAS domain S-box-containing protein
MNVKHTQDNGLESQIEAAHARLEALLQHVGGIPESARQVFEEALENLSVSLEELEVTTEELHQQNDELIATRQDLEAERRRYQEFFELAPGGYLVTDPAGIIQEANQRAAALLNVSEQALIGKPLVLFVAEVDRRAFYNCLEAVEHTPEWELHLQPRERPRFSAQLMVTVIRDLAGQPQGLRWLFQDITERRQAQAEIQQRNRELAALNTIANTINVTPDLTTCLTSALEQIIALLRVDGAECHLRDGHGEPELTAQYGLDAEFAAVSKSFHLPPGTMVPGLSITGQTIVYLPDVQTDERFLRREAARAAGYHSVLCVPLLGGQTSLGAVTLYSSAPREFTTYERTLLLTIGEQLGVAIERARLHQAEQQARQIAETLRLAGLALSQSLDLGVVLETLLDYLARLVPYDSAQVFLVEEDTHLRVRATSTGEHWPEAEVLNQPAFAVSAYANFHAVFKTRQSLLIPDTQTSAWELPLNLEATRSWLGVPLIVSGAVIGLYALDKAQPGFFTQKHIQLAEALASPAAAAVQNAELFEQVRTGRERLGRELHDSLNQSLYSLSLLSEAGRRLIKTGNLPQVDECLSQLGKTAQQALKETRLLVHAWLPSPLKEEGLVGSLQRRLDMVERRAGLEANLIVEGELTLPPAMEETLYLLILEALNNALKHAGADKVTVWLRVWNARLELEIMDNGRGFDPRQSSRRGGVGLASMRERAARLGGLFSLHSTPEQGTQIKVICPLPERANESGRPDQTRPDQTRPDQTRKVLY